MSVANLRYIYIVYQTSSRTDPVKTFNLKWEEVQETGKVAQWPLT